MKKLYGNERKRNLAKVLSLVMGTASLIAPMTLIMGCPASIEIPETPEEPEEEKLELFLDAQGIGNWQEFVEKTMTATADADGLYTYSITETLDNKDDIKGFRGKANYQQVKALLASSDYNKKRYNTSELAIYFDYVPRDGKGIEVTPSILDAIYKKFDTINITDINDYGDKTLVKFSSGDAANPEVIDLERFYGLVKTKKLTAPKDVIVTKNTTSVKLLGVEDPNLRNESVSNSAKLIEMLNMPLFKDAKLDVLKLDGDIKPVMSLLDREYQANNVSFDKQAYYQGEKGENISVYDISKFVERGAYANIHDVNVMDDGNSATVDFSNAKMSNVIFASNTDLSTLATGFDHVTATGTLSFYGLLPKTMTYLNAENVEMDKNAEVPSVDGTDVTGANIKYLRAKSITNVEGFTTTMLGRIEKYDGMKKYVGELKKSFKIVEDGGHTELLTMLRVSGVQRA